MKREVIFVSLVAVAAVVFASMDRATLPDAQIKARTEQSREVAKELGQALSAEMMQAMQDDGPVGAIEVCSLQAPELAGALSRESGWEIHRTSLKARNLTPDEWEAGVLAEFDRRAAAGEDPKGLEFAEVVHGEDGKAQFRYMKAIPTSAKCLMCHGETIAKPLEQKIASLYPNDQARGFKVGDIRGAFSVTQPIH